jgi:general stress protein 26
LKTEPSLKDKLKDLFSSQKLGVLATDQKKNPYTSLIAFACTDDMRQIVFATPKTTKKYSNILSNSSVSLFVDNRSNQSIDFRKAIGVSVIGTVRHIRKNKKSKLMKLYLEKHPQLETFLASPSCAFICIDVNTFHIVERFQDVSEIHLK